MIALMPVTARYLATRVLSAINPIGGSHFGTADKLSVAALLDVTVRPIVCITLAHSDHRFSSYSITINFSFFIFENYGRILFV